MKSLIENHKIIICVGSGGVGKTTVSASLGLMAAHMGKKTLVLTVDPAKRLATTLGLGTGIDEARVPLEGLPPGGELTASIIDSKKVFDDFVKRAMKSDSKAVEKILNNSLYKQLSTTLSGSQEFTALEKLYSAAEEQEYDLIILDTPPTKHAIDFLHAPQKISALFNENVTKWFRDPKGEKTGLFSKILMGGTRKVFDILERLTGAEFIRELREFFVQIEVWQKDLQKRTHDVHRLLTSANCGFVLVTSFDEAKLAEARFFSSEIRKGGYELKSVIINRAFPEQWTDLELGVNLAQGPSEIKLIEFYRHMKVFYSEKKRHYDEFTAQLEKDIQVVQVPEFREDIYSLVGLEKLRSLLEKE